jgi:hypothetical protein
MAVGVIVGFAVVNFARAVGVWLYAEVFSDDNFLGSSFVTFVASIIAAWVVNKQAK